MNGKKNDINKLVEEKLKEKLQEYEKQYTAQIEMKYGNTYISFEVVNNIAENNIGDLMVLFKLMKIKYYVSQLSSKKEFYFVLEGEDKERADFIQKFIDNGYKLTWK